MRAIVMSFFVILLSFFTILAYQEWSEQPLVSSSNDVIELSYLSSVSVQLVSEPENVSLVPEGVILSTNEVTEVYYVYLVETDENCDLSVSLNEAYFVKDDTNYSDEYNLLVFDFEIEEISSSKSEVTVTVSLNMPETETEYNLLVGSQISFSLNFDQEEL